MTTKITYETPKLSYEPTVHAVERFREYFGIKEFYAREFANEIMADTHFVLNQPDGKRVYKNEEYDSMVVLDAKRNTIVTVLPSAAKRKEIEARANTPQISGELFGIIKESVKRELTKARRIFTREHRQLALSIADLNIEIAEAVRNQIRCLHPATQDIIQRNIDDMQAQVAELSEQLAYKKAEYERLQNEAKAFVSTEVT